MFAKRSICNHRIMLVTLLVVGGCLVTHVDGHSIRRKDMEPVAAPVPPKKFVWMEDEVLVDDNDQDLFVPTPQEIQEFQQILLKGLGLSRAPDMSKVRKKLSIGCQHSGRCTSRRNVVKKKWRLENFETEL